MEAIAWMDGWGTELWMDAWWIHGIKYQVSTDEFISDFCLFHYNHSYLRNLVPCDVMIVMARPLKNWILRKLGSGVGVYRYTV